MQRIILFFVLFIFIFQPLIYAGIQEKDLESFKNIFTAKILKDNPGREEEIKNFLNGIVKKGRAGSGIADKFALFMYDSSVNRLAADGIKFFRYRDSTSLFIVLRDESDGKFYNLYLEYVYSKGGDSYSLKDIYFSMIFNDRIDSVRAFFEGD